VNSTEAIALKTAESRFTRAKAAVDGTDENERRYQDAKKELSVLRISSRGRTPHVKPRDAVASVTSLRATATSQASGLQNKE
jgi:hypothetical protein